MKLYYLERNMNLAYTTRPFKNVWVIWVVVSFTCDFHSSETVGIVHIRFTLPLQKYRVALLVSHRHNFH